MAKYYIGRDNQQLGPFDVNQLMAQRIAPDTLVWCEGMAGWEMAKDVPELAWICAQQQPQQQPYQQSYQQSYQQPYQQPYQQSYQQQYQQYQQPQYGYSDPQQEASDNYLAMHGERPQVGFGESIKICFNKFVDLTGRARRSEFWYFYLFSSLVSSATGGLGALVTFLPQMSVTVRRFHDTGHSAWWYFLPMVITFVYSISFLPLLIIASINGNGDMITIGMIALVIFILAMLVIGIIGLVFLCTDSDPEENEYGPSPKYQ